MVFWYFANDKRKVVEFIKLFFTCDESTNQRKYLENKSITFSMRCSSKNFRKQLK